LLAERSDDPDKDIFLYINSPGGSVYSGLAIYDTMQFIKPDVQTICVGVAMSMGSILLAGGAKGKRMALPNSRILIHRSRAGSMARAPTSRSRRGGRGSRPGGLCKAERVPAAGRSRSRRQRPEAVLERGSRPISSPASVIRAFTR
jgi:hypothetical protein